MQPLIRPPALQISAGGKTTSLGDHDTEEEAARAFDRAAINKGGTAAKTNFAMRHYTDEISDLQGELLDEDHQILLTPPRLRDTADASDCPNVVAPWRIYEAKPWFLAPASRLALECCVGVMQPCRRRRWWPC